MKIHEYQGKQILREFGVPVPRGIPAFTVDEAVKAAQELGGPVWVVKAQIHAGPPSSCAALTASSTVNAGMPRGTGTPNSRRICLPWYS